MKRWKRRVNFLLELTLRVLLLLAIVMVFLMVLMALGLVE